jgi:hypothetical protein
VEDRVDSHPEVTMIRSEPFRTTSDLPDSYQAYRRRRRAFAALAPPFAKASFVDELLGPASSHPRGFRVMYDQLRRNPSLLVILRRRRVRVVHLVRTNVLATHVSALLAKRSGVFITRGEPLDVSTVPVPVDSLVSELDRRVHRIARSRWLLARSGLPHIELAYEDYVADPDGHDRRVSAFLGVEERTLRSTFERLSSRAVAERISNRDEVAAILRSTVYGPLLDRY